MVRKATAQEVQILPTSPSAVPAALLDQSRIAGVGNVFPAEVLLDRGRIAPKLILKGGTDLEASRFNAVL